MRQSRTVTSPSQRVRALEELARRKGRDHQRRRAEEDRLARVPLACRRRLARRARVGRSRVQAAPARGRPCRRPRARTRPRPVARRDRARDTETRSPHGGLHACSCYPRAPWARLPTGTRACRTALGRLDRGVLAEFGVDSTDVELRVVDSTADVRPSSSRADRPARARSPRTSLRRSSPATR